MEGNEVDMLSGMAYGQLNRNYGTQMRTKQHLSNSRVRDH